MNLLLVGPSGGGKTESCCTIFGQLNFEEDDWNIQNPKKTKVTTKFTRGQNVKVADTPGLGGSEDSQQIIKEIRRSFMMVPDGFTSIVFVVRFGRISQETESSIQLLREIFGEKSMDFITVVFTHEDHLHKGRNKSLTLDEFVRSIRGNELKNILKACNNRYTAFNNMEESNSNACLKQVDIFFDMLEKLQANNNGRLYTKEMMEEATQKISATEIEKEKQDQREKEERNQQLRREVELEMQTERAKYLDSNINVAGRDSPRYDPGHSWINFIRKYRKSFASFAAFLFLAGLKLWFAINSKTPNTAVKPPANLDA